MVDSIAKNPTPVVRPVYKFDGERSRKKFRRSRRKFMARATSSSDQAKAKLQQFTAWGFGKFPICIAKTQYSFTDDPKLFGAPTGWTLNITDAALSAGAEFVVVISGNMILMPGLPKVSRAAAIDVDDAGEIIGV